MSLTSTTILWMSLITTYYTFTLLGLEHSCLLTVEKFPLPTFTLHVTRLGKSFHKSICTTLRFRTKKGCTILLVPYIDNIPVDHKQARDSIFTNAWQLSNNHRQNYPYIYNVSYKWCLFSILTTSLNIMISSKTY